MKHHVSQIHSKYINSSPLYPRILFWKVNLFSYGHIQLIQMNLLDQLFQYSQTSDISSISFAVLDCEDNMEVSTISQGSVVRSVASSTYNKLFKEQEQQQNKILPLIFDERSVYLGKTQPHLSYKEKYRKLCRLEDILSNKIRKIKYEFIVKLQSKYKKLRTFHPVYKYCEQLTNSKSFAELKSNKSSVLATILTLLQFKSRVNFQKLGFSSIKRMALLREKIQILSSSLSHLYKVQKKSAFAHLKSASKPRMQIKAHPPQLITIRQRTIELKFDLPLFDCFFFEEVAPIKAAIVHPQRRQIQNFDMPDNLNMFLRLNSEIFYQPVVQAEYSRSLRVKDISEKEETNMKKASFLTNISQTVSHYQSCLKTFTQEDIDHKIETDVPAFGFSHSKNQKENIEQHSPIKAITYDQIQQQRKDNFQGEGLTRRFSLQNHQSQLNKYIIYRRSIQKKKVSTLKQIQKSKQTIKKIVYQLQKSKNNEKHKIKLTKKTKLSNQSTERKASIVVQSAYCSPTRPKTIGIKTSRASSSKKMRYADEIKMLTTRELLEQIDNPIFEDLEFSRTPSKDMQMYSEYLKFKNNGNNCPSSNKKGSKKVGIEGVSKKNSAIKVPKPQSGLLIISKDPMLRERRIDVKVDLGKASMNRQGVQEKEKKAGKKAKNTLI